MSCLSNVWFCRTFSLFCAKCYYVSTALCLNAATFHCPDNHIINHCPLFDKTDKEGVFVRKTFGLSQQARGMSTSEG